VWEFFTRLINNNEPNYFYLEASGELTSDSVAFLRLSIALKADVHYDTCLNAKILQLTDMFQAKLGWLVGQLYSRVGTEDWEPSALQYKISDLLDDVAIWVDNQKLRQLETELGKGSTPENFVDRTLVSRTLSLLPSKKKQIIDRIQAIFEEDKNERNEKFISRLIAKLASDAELTALFR
jgi:hypothetical protein